MIRLVQLWIVFQLFLVGIALAGTAEYCTDKWPNDYQMRDYCQEQQGEAQQRLFSIGKKKGLGKNGSLSATNSGGDYEKIINRCMSKWELARFGTYDFEMVVHCINQQFEAYEKTGASGAGSSNKGIEGYCADKWPNDYQMRDYCQEQQVEANQKMFSIAESAGLVKDGTLSVTSQGGRSERIISNCMNK